MLKLRIKRRAAVGGRAVDRLAEIEAAVAALKDEDLLDLADIFSGETVTTLKEMASAEMAKRNISL
ncbi:MULTISPECIES: hypothetical protein [unclassified Sphingomonas]|uniref:hypothetical protein n=1 Tax=unclassified Sphingomonas TaxID=196159 RepID=UPI0006FE46C3|nr:MULTISPECIES: hypothetical protein [unclassified Sphingomonas]KQS46004.1 hypothetical protein ASG20_18445 [Sphingomonas sp. Leaf198]RMB39426.1 hypothetical protein C8J47_0025 [Sphingomonas sp. PP-F2F-G114-C0414]